MSESLKLGELITTEQHRDAIHVAVAPVVAGEDVKPGQHVGFIASDNETVGVSGCGSLLGIIDPFLKCKKVRRGERCWLYLYPGSIQSLRHEWTHIAFNNEPVATCVDKGESEAWLRRFASTHDCPDFETLIRAAVGEDVRPDYDDGYYSHGSYIENDYLHFNGRDAHGDIPDEFWVHVERYTGKRCSQKPRYFTCSC